MKIGFIGQGWIGKNYADDFDARGYAVVRGDGHVVTSKAAACARWASSNSLSSCSVLSHVMTSTKVQTSPVTANRLSVSRH